MANLYCITRDLLSSSRTLRDFNPYKGKLSREDVATLIETFERASADIPVEMIVDVLKNSDDLFAFLIDRNEKGKFDFYKFLNGHYENDTIISPLNSKLMFPRNLSRGIYTEYEDEYEDENDSSDEMDDEGATGYMDVEEEPEVFCLKYDANGDKIPFDERGTIIGRSRQKSDYVVSGNGNLSRSHVKIYLQGGKCIVEDENSSNGTFINGNRLEKGGLKEVNVGDIVMLADEKFTVVRG